MFEIGDRETWKDPMNKFRKNKHVLISSVPTLGLFDGGKVIRKLVEGEIKDAKQRALIYE